MKSPHPIAQEELLERQQLVFALLMCSAGIAIGSAALQEIINTESAFYGVLFVLRYGGAITGLLFMLVLFWKVFILWRRRVCAQLLEGFVQRANLRAMSISWNLTLLALVLMTQHIKTGQALPTDFYTKMASAVLMLTFSLSFILLTRVPGEAEDD